jgi:signal transduction histidine kinase
MTPIIQVLEEKLRLATSDIEKIDIANDLAHELRNIDAERSAQLTEDFLSLSEKLEYTKGMAYGFRNKGFRAFYNVEYEEALANLFKAEELFISIGEETGQASTLLWIGIVYDGMGETGASLEYYNHSLRISESISDYRSMARTLTNIGSAYALIKDHALALQYFTESLQYCDQIGDSIQKAAALSGLGRVHNSLGNHFKALEYELNALELRQDAGDMRGVASSLFFIGRIHEKMGNPQEALRLYLSLYTGGPFNGFHSWKWGRAQIALATGKLYNKLEETDKAYEFALDTLEMSVSIKARKIESEARLLMSAICKKQGNFKEALEHLEHFNALKEIIAGEEVAKASRTLEKSRAMRESELLRIKNEELARLNYELSEANEETETLNQYLTEINRHLGQLNAEKDEFMQIAAHDLKNPLSSIILACEFLRLHRTKITDQETDKRITSIQNTAERMNTIISNVLGANAIESGKMALNIEPVDVGELADVIIEEYRARAEAKGIRIRREDCVAQSGALGDKNAICEILENLISNAVKYSPHNSVISIKVYAATSSARQSTESVIRIEVSDEGPGITADDHKLLFKKFARLSAKPTAGESSTGLGLSIAKKMTEAMSGKIYCESEPGKGATFIVEFPAAANEIISTQNG